MSQKRRQRDFSSIDDVDVRGLRQDRGAPIITGYQPSEAGRPAPIPGDEKFPFFKDPPDLEGPTRYMPPIARTNEGNVTNAIPLVGTLSDYTVLDAIDVAEFRLLKLFITYGPGANNAELSMLVEHIRDDDAGVWYLGGFVDATVAASAIVPGGATRSCFASDLRHQAGGVTTQRNFDLVFDVSTELQWRLRVGDTVSAASGLELWYALMR